MFKRRTGDAPALLDDDQTSTEAANADAADDGARQRREAARTAAKGRPTPKRSEVERRRREPYTPPPSDRKAASTQQRQRRREESKRRMEAMRRGEEWALPRKDKGPVKALARDYIDSRRLVVSEYVLFGVFALLLLLFVLGGAKNSSVILLTELGILGLIVAESSYHTFRVASLIRQRLPGQSTRGLNYYILKRSIRLRSTRIPPARVARGAAI